MGRCRLYSGFAVFLISIFSLSFGQEVVPKPTFPDAFQVEVEGMFTDQLMELDGSLYYDRKNNRAAVFYTFQKDSTKVIYNFNDNELITLQGNECSVSEISDEPEDSFFTFTKDKNTGKKLIGSPEDVLYFTNSTLDNEGVSIFPAYVFEAKVYFTLYRRSNCTIRHIFTKPEVETADCNSLSCQPMLLTISVNCPAFVKEETEFEEGGVVESIEHLYNFHRFKPRILDEGVFQPPSGTFCNLTSHEEFPGLPDYFSFSYDFQEDMTDYLSNSGVAATHKKVWYDSKLKLVRVDEFEDNGLLISSRIFDFHGEIAYTIVTNVAECEKGAIEDVVDLSGLTRLPKLFFKTNLVAGDAVYIGKKKAHGLSYDVWSASTADTESDSRRVEEFFYRTVLGDVGTKTKRQISHVDVYMYGRNPDTQVLEMSVNAYYSINNFRSDPKEWEAFDVSACFEHDQRKAFRLKVTGPAVVRNSFFYEELLEGLYMKIISCTKVSVVRISELTGIYDGVHLIEFKGWILDKPTLSTNHYELDMHKVYDLLKNAASTGNLDIKFDRLGKEVQYSITMTEEATGSDQKSNGILIAVIVCSVVGILIIGSGSYYIYRKGKPSRFNDPSVRMSSMR